MRGYLGLGSNVGDRLANMRAACRTLPEHGVRITGVSSIYETAPQGDVLDQRDFLNAVVEIDTELGPEELLDACKSVESALGRDLGGVRHGPRPIDVDLLLLGDEPYRSERLQIPHRDLETRRFVLEPLSELAPERVGADKLAAVADQAVTQVEGTLTPTWREAVEAHDLALLAQVLAPDARLRSPITVTLKFEGRDRVLDLMADVFGLLESVHVVRDIREGPVQVLEIESRLAGYDMHMVQMIELDEQQLVTQITLFMRPLPGVANLAAHLAPRLVGRRRGPVVAAFVAAPLRLAALVLRVSERLAPRFV